MKVEMTYVYIRCTSQYSIPQSQEHLHYYKAGQLSVEHCVPFCTLERLTADAIKEGLGLVVALEVCLVLFLVLDLALVQRSVAICRRLLRRFITCWERSFSTCTRNSIQVVNIVSRYASSVRWSTRDESTKRYTYGQLLQLFFNFIFVKLSIGGFKIKVSFKLQRLLSVVWSASSTTTRGHTSIVVRCSTYSIYRR